MAGNLSLNGELKLYKVDFKNGKVQYLLFCEACQCCHAYDERGKFNGDMDFLTFTPFVLVTKPNEKYRCHFFVTNGKIKCLKDCLHDMAGK